MSRALLFLLCMMLPGGLAAQTVPAVSLVPGESVVLKVQDGQWTVSERTAAGALSAFEKGVVAKLQATDIPPDAGVQPAVPVMEGDIDAPRDAVSPGIIRITFRHVPGAMRGQPGESHAVLSVDNGYDHSFFYRAMMHKEGKRSATDVCEVLPQMHGLEHWPYRIERLELSALKLEPYSGGDPLCE
jgi:hypothetical protein